MMYMVLFLGICLVLGLWTPRKLHLSALVAVLAVVIVLFYLLLPSKM